MKPHSLLRLVLSAMFAALVCVATMVIQIPSPMSGYVNMGDCIVLMSGWILGPIYGTLAAAIGSCFADIFSGYVIYAPATFIIKGLVAFLAWLIFRAMQRAKMNTPVSRICSGIVGEAAMVGGYFLYAALVFGEGLAAASSIPGNVMQGIFGITAGILLTEAVVKIMKNRDR